MRPRWSRARSIWCLWPEDVVNVRQLLIDTPEYGELQQLARELDAWLIAGIFERLDPETNANASIAFDPDGNEVDRYDKVRLVPFGEFVPLRSLIEPLAPDYLPARDTRPGRGRLGHARHRDRRRARAPRHLDLVGGLLRRSGSRDAIGNGGEILINPTNGSSYWLTILQTQQVASSRLRAMETGRWVLQAAPTGFSAVIDPDGNLLQRTAVSEAAVLQDTVELRSGARPSPPESAAGRCSSSPSLALGGSLGRLPPRLRTTGQTLQEDGHGAVVLEGDEHVGAESAGLDVDTEAP